MGPVDYLIIAIIVGIFGFAGWFIYRSKKSGKKCIGCPDSGSCSGSCASCACGCGKNDK
jgi:hypothetical protein